jgi:hypothetical protein
LLQVPQWAVLVMLSTQTPPHVVCPVGQPQAPFAHAWPPEQRLPHEPQLVASVSTSGQLLPHCISPAAQVAEQVPFEHSSPPVQAVSQVPQLAPSEETFTQPDVHAMRPAVHVQAPLLQVCPAAHLVPQVPQF